MDERDHLGVGHSAGREWISIDGKVTLPTDPTLNPPQASGAHTTGNHLADTSNLPNASDAYGRLQADNVALRSESAALKDKLESAKLDRGMLRLELGSVTLERHGWRLERERLQKEMADMMGERDRLREDVTALREEMGSGRGRRHSSEQEDHANHAHRPRQTSPHSIIDLENEPSPILAERSHVVPKSTTARRREGTSRRPRASSSEESMDVCDIHGKVTESARRKHPRDKSQEGEQQQQKEVRGKLDAVAVGLLADPIDVDLVSVAFAFCVS
jgi:chromosome segregation ATPase